MSLSLNINFLQKEKNQMSNNIYKSYVDSQKSNEKQVINGKKEEQNKENNYELENYDLEQCRTCEKQFVVDPKAPRKVCIVCWKKEKNYKISVSDTQIIWLQQAIDDEVTAVKLNRGGLSKTAQQLINAETKLAKQGKEIEELNAKIKQLELEKKGLRGEIGKFMLGENIIVGGKWSFSSKRIKTILKFVHPDKVEEKDKPVARGIASWLLDYLSHVKKLEKKLEEKKKIPSKYPKWHSKHNTDI